VNVQFPDDPDFSNGPLHQKNAQQVSEIRLVGITRKVTMAVMEMRKLSWLIMCLMGVGMLHTLQAQILMFDLEAAVPNSAGVLISLYHSDGGNVVRVATKIRGKTGLKG
jgi:hypothetical protein